MDSDAIIGACRHGAVKDDCLICEDQSERRRTEKMRKATKMKTLYKITASDLAFAQTFSCFSQGTGAETTIETVLRDIERYQDSDTQISEDIISDYCVWNAGVKYGKNLPDSKLEEK